MGEAVLEVTNIGDKPAFHTGIEITNADCRYVCDDNYFMLMPGETKRVTFEIDRSIQPFYDCVKPELIEPVGSELRFTATAWNAPAEVCTVRGRCPTASMKTTYLKTVSFHGLRYSRS